METEKKAVEIGQKHFRTLQEIRKAYPEVSDFGKELRDVFGSYAGVKIVADGKCIFSWSRPQPFKKPSNTILDENGDYRDPNHKPHRWNDGLRKKR